MRVTARCPYLEYVIPVSTWATTSHCCTKTIVSRDVKGANVPANHFAAANEVFNVLLRSSHFIPFFLDGPRDFDQWIRIKEGNKKKERLSRKFDWLLVRPVVAAKLGDSPQSPFDNYSLFFVEPLSFEIWLLMNFNGVSGELLNEF